MFMYIIPKLKFFFNEILDTPIGINIICPLMEWK